MVDLAVDTKESDGRSMAFVFWTVATARPVVERVDFTIFEKHELIDAVAELARDGE